jgi:hypothetical protein
VCSAEGAPGEAAEADAGGGGCCCPAGQAGEGQVGEAQAAGRSQGPRLRIKGGPACLVHAIMPFPGGQMRLCIRS